MEQEIFQECIQLYSAFDKEAAKKIQVQDLSSYEFYPTHLGEENLVLRISGKDFFFHDPRGALREAEHWFKSLRIEGIDLLYIYGIGLGVYFEALKKWLYEDKKRFVVFLEDDLAVLHMLFKTKRGLEILKSENVLIQTFSFVDNRVNISLDKRFSEIFAAFYNKNPLLSALRMYGEIKEKILLSIKSQIYISLSWQKILHADKETLLPKITRNIIGNILRIDETSSFASLEGGFEGIPALISGAGPSITKEIEVLKEAKGKCLLIGSGTGTNILNQQGIFPHFFVGLDPTVSQESRIRMNQSYVIPCFHKVRFSSIASKILSGERVLIKGCNSPFQTTWFEKNLCIDHTEDIETGISSTTFALNIALHLGCNPIILVGLDLAYTENKRYPEGISLSFGNKEMAKELYEKSKNLVIGKGYLGEEVLTKIDWLIEGSIITHFQKTHAQLKIVNATQGGLRIEEVDNTPLSDMIKDMPYVDDMEGRLHALIHRESLSRMTPEEVLKIIGYWESHIESYLTDLDKARKECEGKEFQNEEDVEAPIDRFIHEERKNPFFDIFFPNYLEIEKGYLFLAKRGMQRESILNNRNAFLKHARDYIDIFFSFWKRIANSHLEAVRLETVKFEAEYHHLTFRGKPWNDPIKEAKYTLDSSLKKQEIKKQDGSLLGEFYKKEGVLEGPCLYFGKEGELLSLSNFKEGILEGIQEKYFSSGKLFSKQYYSEGLLEGKQEFYFESGIPKALLEYHLGKLSGNVFLYYQNGRLKREVHFKEGFQEGVEKYFDETGVLLFVSEFKKGKPFGEAFEYYYNGKLLRKIVFDSLGQRVFMQEWDLEGREVEEAEAQESELKVDLKYALEEYKNDMTKLMSAFGEERKRLFL